MRTLIQDAKYGLRILLKNPGFTAVAILTLTLGIGASTAIFTVVNAVLLQSLPFNDPGRLVWISATNPKSDPKEDSTPVADFIDWRTQNQTFEDMTALGGGWAKLTGGEEPETVLSGQVGYNFFSVLGVMPRIGRNFTPDDGAHGAQPVTIISNSFWKSHLGGSPDVVGSTIQIWDKPVTIIGVMPPGFVNAEPAAHKPVELWMPRELVVDDTHRRTNLVNVIGRLKPGVSIAQAQQDMAAVTSALEQQYPATNTGWSAKLQYLHDNWVGDVRPALLLLSGAVVFLLLIACANLANLMLARTAARNREIAIRAALGAGRGRLIQQLLTESVLLSIVGGALGVLLAWRGVKILTAMAPSLASLGNIRTNWQVLFFALIASVATGVLFGLLPALNVSRGADPRSLSAGRGIDASGVGGRRTRDLLAAAEVAMALIMLIGSGLMINSFIRLQREDPGFKTDNLLTLSILTPREKMGKGKGKQVDDFCNQVISGVEGVPGCVGAAAVMNGPLVGGSNKDEVTIEGRTVGPDEDKPDAEFDVCSSGYFQVLGIPLIAGREFNQFDTLESTQVAIINQTMARRYWPNEDPLGKRVGLSDPVQWLTVVGIVGDTRTTDFDVRPYAQIYVPHSQSPSGYFSLLVRTAGDPMSMSRAIKARIRSIDSHQDFFNTNTFDRMAADLLAGPKFNMILMTIFAAIAAVIAAVGIYGVISYSVTQRTREIGIRMAIGASHARVMRLVVGQGAVVIAVGLGVGLAGAFGLTRLMSSLLYSVTPTDAATFEIVTAVLGGVSLLACYVPARRASKVDPIVALRYE